MVAYLKAGNDLDAKKMLDMTLTAYRDAIDYLGYYRETIGSMVDFPGSKSKLRAKKSCLGDQGKSRAYASIVRATQQVTLLASLCLWMFHKHSCLKATIPWTFHYTLTRIELCTDTKDTRMQAHQRLRISSENCFSWPLGKITWRRPLGASSKSAVEYRIRARCQSGVRKTLLAVCSW